MGRKFFDGVSAMQKDAALAVDEGDRRIAARGRHEPRVVGEVARLCVERPDVNDLGTVGTSKHGKIVLPPVCMKDNGHFLALYRRSDRQIGKCAFHFPAPFLRATRHHSVERTQPGR
jgi:hypothetical protein